MFDHHHYVPILKGKAGEYNALRQLALGPKSCLTPVIEVPPIPWDYKNDQPARTIDEHLKDAAKKIDRAWDSERSLFADVGALVDERMADGRHPITYLFDSARDRGLELIPVSGLNRIVRTKTLHVQLSRATREAFVFALKGPTAKTRWN